MRPESIGRFDLFYLGSLALSVVNFFLEHANYVATIEAQARGGGVLTGTTAVDIVFACWAAVMLLLWYLVAWRRNVIAKWIIIVLVAFSLIALLPGLGTSGFTTVKLVSLLSVFLSIVAVYFLFQPDTKAWLAGETAPAEPDAGD
jgi:hypothetical protein